MSGEYFVLQVSEDGIPGKLEGPVQRVLAITAKHEPVTDEVREAVDMDGSWSYQDGGGVYIVQSEPVTGRQIGRNGPTCSAKPRPISRWKSPMCGWMKPATSR